jgi:hypothetical protein
VGLDLVRSTVANCGRGDFSSTEWAHPEIEFTHEEQSAPPGALAQQTIRPKQESGRAQHLRRLRPPFGTHKWYSVAGPNRSAD